MLLRESYAGSARDCLRRCRYPPKLDQPVGEQQIGKGMRLVMLLLECGEQPLRADADKPRAKHRSASIERADQLQRQRHDRGRRQRKGRCNAFRGLRRQALLQQLQLAEHLAMHDALDAERALAETAVSARSAPGDRHGAPRRSPARRAAGRSRSPDRPAGNAFAGGNRAQ